MKIPELSNSCLNLAIVQLLDTLWIFKGYVGVEFPTVKLLDITAFVVSTLLLNKLSVSVLL